MKMREREVVLERAITTIEKVVGAASQTISDRSF